MTQVVEKIVSGGLCHGCGACAAALGSAKLRMQMTEAGYLRPMVQAPLTTADEAAVQEVCSGTQLRQDAGGRHYDRIWGPLVSLETGHANDPEIRYRGSSGGVLTAALVFLLEAGEIDFVLQTGADPNDPIGNTSAISLTRADIVAAAGSRYAPSSPLVRLEEMLKTDKRFAFVGKPCDVAALRMMAVRDSRIAQQVPYMLSFFCAGVPSRRGALGVLSKLGVEERDVATFDYRGRGWPGLARAVRHDGSEASMDYHSSWGSILNRHLQFRCKICPEGIGEFADIACADAWYGKDGYPDFTERDGRSLVVARTEKGRHLLDRMNAARALVLDPVAIGELKLMQPYQYDRRRAVLIRLAAMRAHGKRIPKYRGLSLAKVTFWLSPLSLLKNFVGTFRRISRGSPLN